MGACFQAPHCHTQTMTDGNALSSLISFVFQLIALTRSYKVTYQWFELVKCKLIRQTNEEYSNKLYMQCLMLKCSI